MKAYVFGCAVALLTTAAAAQGNCGLKDQTDPEIKASLLSNSITVDTKGTCVFLLPNPAKGTNKYMKVPVDNVSYKDCVTRAEEAVAAKWYPPSKMSFKAISDAIPNGCPSECSGFPATCPGICYCVGTTHCE